MANVEVFQHNGEPVELNSQHEFYVPSIQKSYETAQQATAAIDRKIDQEKKVAKKKLSLPVVALDLDGITTKVITGIHSGTGKKLVTPKSGKYSSEDLYPSTPVLNQLLTHCNELSHARQKAMDALRDFRLSSDPYYGNGCFNLESRFDAVEAEYVLKTATATPQCNELRIAKEDLYYVVSRIKESIEKEFGWSSDTAANLRKTV